MVIKLKKRIITVDSLSYVSKSGNFHCTEISIENFLKSKYTYCTIKFIVFFTRGQDYGTISYHNYKRIFNWKSIISLLYQMTHPGAMMS